MKLKIISMVTLFSLALTGAALGFISAFSKLDLGIGAAVFVVIEATLLYGIFARRSPVFGRIFWRGPKSLRAVAITFDDGPNEPYTSQILDILRQFEIKATFFLIGKNVERFPEAVRREVAEGHELGNHTYNHEVLPLKSGRYIRAQIKAASALIEKISGAPPRLFRAPHGWRNPFVNRLAKAEGCIPVAWTLGVWDTDRPGAAEIVRRTQQGLCNGCVLLLHDGRGTEHGTDTSQLVAALPTLLRSYQHAGFKFLTLSEMLKETKAR